MKIHNGFKYNTTHGVLIAERNSAHPGWSFFCADFTLHTNEICRVVSVEKFGAPYPAEHFAGFCVNSIWCDPMVQFAAGNWYATPDGPAFCSTLLEQPDKAAFLPRAHATVGGVPVTLAGYKAGTPDMYAFHQIDFAEPYDQYMLYGGELVIASGNTTDGFRELGKSSDPNVYRSWHSDYTPCGDWPQISRVLSPFCGTVVRDALYVSGGKIYAPEFSESALIELRPAYHCGDSLFWSPSTHAVYDRNGYASSAEITHAAHWVVKSSQLGVLKSGDDLQKVCQMHIDAARVADAQLATAQELRFDGAHVQTAAEPNPAILLYGAHVVGAPLCGNTNPTDTAEQPKRAVCVMHYKADVAVQVHIEYYGDTPVTVVQEQAEKMARANLPPGVTVTDVVGLDVKL